MTVRRSTPCQLGWDCPACLSGAEGIKGFGFRGLGFRGLGFVMLPYVIPYMDLFKSLDHCRGLNDYQWFHIPHVIMVYNASNGPQNDIGNHLGPCSTA